MTGRDVARVINTGRIALGAALMLAPRRTARGWIGADADAPGAMALARALGVRDAVLGAMGLHTMDNPQVAPRWQRTLALCDGVDLAATLAVRRSLPPVGVALTVVMAGVAAGAQLWAAGELGKIEPAPESVFPAKRPSQRV
jgi:hypothetical protein